MSNLQGAEQNVTQHESLVAEAWRLRVNAGQVSLCRSDRCPRVNKVDLKVWLRE